MTTSDNISAIEAIEAAMKNATPGEWIAYELPGGASTVPVPIAFISGPTRVIRDRSEGFSPADAAYIAACNPVAMSAILAEARKAEALKREIAELRKALRPFADHQTADGLSGPDSLLYTPDAHPLLFNGLGDETRVTVTVGDIRRARTLLNGGSDA